MDLRPEHIERFSRYRQLLLEWNQRLNLTAIDDPADVDLLHFADSLACLLVPFAPAANVLDVGAGAGFPGVPLWIVRPDIDLTLLEATAKKARFLEQLAEELGPPAVRVVAQRAEDAAHGGLRETQDVVVARAVAALPALLELTLPFARLGGRVLALKKGAALPDELASADRALEVLGGVLGAPVPYDVAGERRTVVVIDKVRATPSAYPRRSGLPAKRPLR